MFPARRSFSACLSILILVIASASVRAQPDNDDCANAIEVVDGTYAGTSLGATGDGFATCGSSFGPDVWYRFTASFQGVLFAHLCEGATFDANLSIFNGCPLDGGEQLTCNDDSCGMLRPAASIDITPSQTYWIRVCGFEGESGDFTLTIHSAESLPIFGPDVVLSDFTDVDSFGPVGDVRAYITDTFTCNVGDTSLMWGNTSPLVTWNAYRLYGGRLEQIGLSWVKNGSFATSGPGCGQTCQGGGGNTLGAGCRDVYDATFNSIQSNLGPRSQVNAFTGAYPGPSGSCTSDTAICKRLQINQNDLDPNQFFDALYFFELVYVAVDDALSNNAANNVSYARVVVDENFDIVRASPVNIGHLALEAWRNHAFGLNTPDPEVILGFVDVPQEGRFHYGYRVRQVDAELWRYEYAIYNLNSNQAGGSFNVPVPSGVTISNVGFHDVDYHSGEVLDNTDWTVTVDAAGVTWASPQTFAENPNSNALRYGTLYNFWFDATSGPAPGSPTLGLFAPGLVDSVQAAMAVPAAPIVCNLTGDLNQDQLRDGLDVQHFVECALFGASAGADCDCADMDGSGSLDETDRFIFVFALLGF